MDIVGRTLSNHITFLQSIVRTLGVDKISPTRSEKGPVDFHIIIIPQYLPKCYRH